MNQIKDIFNTQFFVVLGVVLLLVTCLVLYIEQKFKAYDHKMSSMLSLVSSLAEEMDIFKNNRFDVGGHTETQSKINELNEKIEENKLIDVSDDENEANSDDDSEYVSDSDSSSSILETDDDDSETDLNVTSNKNHKTVNDIDLGSDENEIITIHKIEEHNQSNNIIELNKDSEHNNDLIDLDEKYELDKLDESDESVDLNSSNMDDLNDTNVVEELDDLNDTNVAEELDEVIEIDYNKFSVAKLKEIAYEKNLISNISNKMKKAELLDMLDNK